MRRTVRSFIIHVDEPEPAPISSVFVVEVVSTFLVIDRVGDRRELAASLRQVTLERSRSELSPQRWLIHP